MLAQQLVKLKDFILAKNTYFAKGYSHVTVSEKTGKLYSGDTLVFPADNMGNYFYLRVDPKVQVLYTNDYIADNYLGITLSPMVTLVAYVKDGDADKLIFNLLSTIGNYEEHTKIKSYTTVQENVIIEELSETDEETIMKALGAMKMTKSALVSLSFNLQFPQSLLNIDTPGCIVNPCSC